MAKRKRKMTLFDVMHNGQSVGLQVRTRVPSYQPTPELPVTKKLAKLFGRTPKSADANRPRSAADELAELRRELAAKNTPSTPVEASEPVPSPVAADVDDEVEVPLVNSFREEPVAAPPQPARRKSAHDFAAELEEEEFRETGPRISRRPIGEVLRERWALLSPKLGALAAQLKSVGGQSSSHAARGLGFAREMYSRYAVTTGAALGVVILLCGSFYAGKLLFNRPASNAIVGGTSVAENNVRPDVLDVNNATHSNEPIANIDSTQTQTTLERQPETTTPKSTVFGGRRTDLNYVIVQSYRTQAEAIATSDVLAKYGVRTTVELNLPRWASAGTTLYSVVSVEGFQKLSGNDQYKAFISKIATISDKEAGQTLPKRLEPGVYKWAAAAQ